MPLRRNPWEYLAPANATPGLENITQGLMEGADPLTTQGALPGAPTPFAAEPVEKPPVIPPPVEPEPPAPAPPVVPESPAEVSLPTSTVQEPPTPPSASPPESGAPSPPPAPEEDSYLRKAIEELRVSADSPMDKKKAIAIALALGFGDDNIKQLAAQQLNQFSVSQENAKRQLRDLLIAEDRSRTADKAVAYKEREANLKAGVSRLRSLEKEAAKSGADVSGVTIPKDINNLDQINTAVEGYLDAIDKAKALAEKAKQNKEISKSGLTAFMGQAAKMPELDASKAGEWMAAYAQAAGADPADLEQFRAMGQTMMDLVGPGVKANARVLEAKINRMNSQNRVDQARIGVMKQTEAKLKKESEGLAKGDLASAKQLSLTLGRMNTGLTQKMNRLQAIDAELFRLEGIASTSDEGLTPEQKARYDEQQILRNSLQNEIALDQQMVESYRDKLMEADKILYKADETAGEVFANTLNNWAAKKNIPPDKLMEDLGKERSVFAQPFWLEVMRETSKRFGKPMSMRELLEYGERAANRRAMEMGMGVGDQGMISQGMEDQILTNTMGMGGAPPPGGTPQGGPAAPGAPAPPAPPAAPAAPGIMDKIKEFGSTFLQGS